MRAQAEDAVDNRLRARTGGDLQIPIPLVWLQPEVVAVNPDRSQNSQTAVGRNESEEAESTHVCGK